MDQLQEITDEKHHSLSPIFVFCSVKFRSTVRWQKPFPHMLKLLKIAITFSPMEYVWINHAINKQAMTDWNQTVVCCLYKADHDPHQLIIYPEIVASTPLYGASQRSHQRIRYRSLPPDFDARRPTRN